MHVKGLFATVCKRVKDSENRSFFLMSFKWKQSQKGEVRTARAEAESAGRVEASLGGRRRRLGRRFLPLRAQRYGGVVVCPQRRDLQCWEDRLSQQAQKEKPSLFMPEGEVTSMLYY